MIFRRIYSGWMLLWFIVFFLIFLPAFLVIIWLKLPLRYSFYLNKIWAKLLFIFWFMPVKAEYRFKPEKGQTYIYCPNHTSYLDIPVVGISAPTPCVFLGKNSLSKIPLFGYMYSKLNITVDRASSVARRLAMLRAAALIDQGIGLVIFPEGTIPQRNPPVLFPFQKGAFGIAVNKQVPIVPVTIPDNWVRLSGDGKYIPRLGIARIIFHEPIITAGLTSSDTEALKQRVFDSIKKELDDSLKS